jgi:hypothetical protein
MSSTLLKFPGQVSNSLESLASRDRVPSNSPHFPTFKQLPGFNFAMFVKDYDPDYMLRNNWYMASEGNFVSSPTRQHA